MIINNKIKTQKKIKIVITGFKGNLATYLAEILKTYNLFLYNKDSFDITNPNCIKKILYKIKPNVVINCAAYNSVDKCEIDKKECNRAFNINGKALNYLALICHNISALLIHYSTDYVFNGKNKNGYKENFRPYPISLYGQSKLLGETNIRKQIKKYYIIRTSKLFGNKGSSLNSKPDFIDKIIELSQKKQTIKCINQEISSPTYAKDLAKQTKHLIENKYPFGIYHITNYNSCSWFEFANHIFKVLEIKNTKLFPVKQEYFKRPAQRPKHSVLLNTKLPPLKTWENALTQYLKYEK
jgi:dTDP-4-dehydrorhamnose reductase